MRRLLPLFVAALVVLAGCGGGGTSSPTAEGTEPSDGTPTPGATDSPASTAPSETTTDSPTPESTPTPEPTPTPESTPTPTPEPTPTPTPEPTPTPSDSSVDGADAIPGVEGGAVTNGTKLAGAFAQEVFLNHTDFVLNVSENADSATGEQFSYVFRNDTEQQYHAITDRGNTTEYFIQNGTDGKFNRSTGEISYGDDGFIQAEAGFSQIILLAFVNYVAPLDWQVTGQQTIDGEQFYTLEADSLNESALARNGGQFNLSNSDLGNLSSARGSLTINADGVVRSGFVEFERNDGTTLRVEYSLETGADIDVTPPEWFEPSSANSDS